MNKSSIWQMIKFTLFSISAGIIQAGSFALLLEVCHLRYWISYLVSLVLSIVWNFTFNRRYTFKSAVNIPVAMAKMFGFYAMRRKTRGGARHKKGRPAGRPIEA